VRPIGDAAKEAAFEQVMNYARQNRDEMRRIVQTEVDVSLEKDGYILTGKVDLLLGGDGKLELLDFKTSPRPKDSPDLLAAYERQLCTYAHILEQRHRKRVDRLLLYWTSEPRKADALMVLPYHPARVEEAGRHFDAVVRRIQAKDFAVKTPPEPGICKECDLRMLCHAEGILRSPQALA
jgi:DNA helicase-2/ATP-dependent DNA helicase PcrA